MQQGLKISFGAHAVVIGFALFGTGFAERKPPSPPAAIAVELISSDAFAPNLPPDPLSPEPPKLTAVAPQAPTEPPEPIETAAIADFEQSGHIDTEPVVKATPQVADIISDEITKAPDLPAPDRISAPIKSEQPEQRDTPVPKTDDSIARKTTTEIVTEADKISEQVPIKATRPKHRPQTLASATHKPDAAQQQIADDILKAVQQAQTEAQGPQLSLAQQATLAGLINSHLRRGWRFSGGIEKGRLPLVEIQIQVFADGRIGADVKRLMPRKISTRFDQLAVNAANSAIERGRQIPILLNAEFSDFIGSEGKEFVIVFDPRKIERKW